MTQIFHHFVKLNRIEIIRAEAESGISDNSLTALEAYQVFYARKHLMAKVLVHIEFENLNSLNIAYRHARSDKASFKHYLHGSDYVDVLNLFVVYLYFDLNSARDVSRHDLGSVKRLVDFLDTQDVQLADKQEYLKFAERLALDANNAPRSFIYRGTEDV